MSDENKWTFNQNACSQKIKDGPAPKKKKIERKEEKKKL